MAGLDALNKLGDLTPDQCNKLDVFLKEKGDLLGRLDSGMSLDELESVVGGDEITDPFFDLMKEGLQPWIVMAQFVNTGKCPVCNMQVGQPPINIKAILDHVKDFHSK